jgi:glycosyltransferase involved in cell wall biosynthesis
VRVLLLTSTLPRWSGDAQPTFVLELAQALQQAFPQLEIRLLAPHHRGAMSEETSGGLRIHRYRYCWPAGLQRLAYPAILPNLRRQPWLWLQVPLLLVAQLLAILRLSRQWRPDVLYAHWFAPQGLAAGVAGLITGTPQVLTTHSSDVAVMRRLPLLGPALARVLLRRLTAATAVSARTAAALLEVFPAGAERAAMADRLLTVPMGVALAELSPPDAAAREAARRAWQLGAAPVVLFLGRLTAKKGVSVLVEAFAQLQRDRPAARLLIAGDGDTAAGLQRQVAAAGLQSAVRFTGYVDAAVRRELLAAADVLVLPSIVAADGDTEGLPVVLLEGLATGLPVIASDASGAGEVLTPGDDGWLIPAGDAGRLAAALAEVLDLAPAERARVSARARARATDFDWPVIAARHYRHLLAPLSRAERPR